MRLGFILRLWHGAAAAAALLVFLSACSNKPSEQELNAFLKNTFANLVYVEGGSFIMGDGGWEITDENGNTVVRKMTGDPDDDPGHKVTLDSFYMQKFEVTNDEADIFSRANGVPTFLDRFYLRNKLKKPKNDDFAFPGIPARSPDWQSAKDYCVWLGHHTGLPFDLPTEAQWEYAARSRGQNLLYATDNGRIEPGRNYLQGREDKIKVGSYPPNPLGLHDMMGNMNEWTNDWFDPTYYARSPEHNPQGPQPGDKYITGLKVARGGGGGSPEYNTNLSRTIQNPETGSQGFRCVLNLPEKLDAAALLKRARHKP